jgi:hypothetical protein
MQKPQGRMTLRRNAIGDGQRPRIRLWSLGDPPENSTLAKLQKHYLRTFENIDRIDAKKAELARNQDLTDIGRQRAALDFSFTDAMPDVLRSKRALAKAMQEAATMRSKLKTPKADPADMAAALRRQELRQAMRTMDAKTRDKFLNANGRLDGLNPEILLAIVEMPATMSGVSDTMHDDFMRQAPQSEPDDGAIVRTSGVEGVESSVPARPATENRDNSPLPRCDRAARLRQNSCVSPRRLH